MNTPLRDFRMLLTTFPQELQTQKEMRLKLTAANIHINTDDSTLADRRLVIG